MRERQSKNLRFFLKFLINSSEIQLFVETEVKS